MRVQGGEESKGLIHPNANDSRHFIIQPSTEPSTPHQRTTDERGLGENESDKSCFTESDKGTIEAEEIDSQRALHQGPTYSPAGIQLGATDCGYQ